MRRSILLVLLAVGCARPTEHHVVLISVDGLAAFYLNDPKAHLPTIRRLAKEGAAAEGMRASFPSVTWPNHTTLVTGVPPGRHGVIGNSYYDRAQGKSIPFIPDPLFDKDQIVKVPTVYDAAHRAGLSTAAVIWPATRNAATLDRTMPDVKPMELFLKYSTTAWMDELRAAGIWVDSQEKWCGAATGGVMRDWMYARAAAQLLRVHRPRLLLLHLVEADHAQHGFGPRSPEGYWSVSYVDDRVRDVVEAIEAAGLKERTTLIVASDHGFLPYTKIIQPNAALKKAGLKATAISQGGGAFVYLQEPERRQEIRALLAKLEGVEAIFEPRERPELGLADPAQDPRMADLAMSAKKGYSFGDSAAGEEIVATDGQKGSHGHLPDHPEMHATFVAWGAGVKPGTRLGLIENLDVAPTIARLLGVELPGVQGRVLQEILR